MKVILKKDVGKLGRAGEVKEVNDGFARNFLIPRNLAVFATAQEMQKATAKQTQQLKSMEKALVLVKRLREKLKNQRFDFVLPGDEKGHLYTGLKQSEIFAKIKDRGFSLPENATLIDYSPLRSAGIHEIRLGLASKSIIPIVIEIQTKLT